MTICLLEAAKLEAVQAPALAATACRKKMAACHKL